MRNGAPRHAFSHECKAEAYNITVNAIIPGLVDTSAHSLRDGASRKHGRERPKAADNPTPQQAWDSRSPHGADEGRLAPVGRHFPVAVFLASDAANLVTGAEYEVTAGDSAKDI